ncbi:hypothetical protein HRbin17_02570 [bacterium HR17]|uniref:Phosphatidic acid phosphatase type 2/haloperoxidase domain-containing protein n=1 Tax=Candidatus Fervidibacter japonicus TaxID=2035412 RepID=A0A2H5XFT4_9BACT|nr:hypothetical protein HRbin17_02570 [bacterium HR17]
MGLAAWRNRFDAGVRRVGRRFALFVAGISPLSEAALWLALFLALAVPIAVGWQPLTTMDSALLRWVNRGWASAPLDAVMRFLSSMGKMPSVWVGLLVWLAVVFWWRHRCRRASAVAWFKTVLAIAVAISLADGLSSRVAKQLVHRERPPRLVRGVRLVDGVGRSLGFPSSHAANAFAVARVLQSVAPPRLLWWALAVTIALSRVYLGVHFPADSVGGALLGLSVGAFVIAIWQTASAKARG